MMMVTRRLTREQILSSPEINDWLNQFEMNERVTAQSMLLQLRFIDRDSFQTWLEDKIKTYSGELEGNIGLYSVRKMGDADSYWDDQGKVVLRPATPQGSEDFIASILKDPKRRFGKQFFDHPSIETMRKHKIRHVMLVDDSIGSGGRLGEFIEKYFKNATIRSWWSGHFFSLHIIGYSRSIQSEESIVAKVPGFKNNLRNIGNKKRVFITSEIKFDIHDRELRWGIDHNKILALCNFKKVIEEKFRTGYGNAMVNTIFYHSVPNNIPGILFLDRKGWKPLFPNRKFPSYLQGLLEGKSKKIIEEIELFYKYLRLIKFGITKEESLAKALDVDESIISYLSSEATRRGLVVNGKITRAGINYLYSKYTKDLHNCYDFSIYIPSGVRCVDRVTAQQNI